MTREEVFQELKNKIKDSTVLNLPAPKLKDLKKDPFLLARIDLHNGGLYFEYAPNHNNCLGMYLIHKIGNFYSMPGATQKEKETLFIQLGFYNNVDKLVLALEKNLINLQDYFKSLCLSD